MSEPSGNRVTRPFRELAARVSRWQNTRRGTATLKGMYAQAARDAKRMDPAVRERIGRSNLTKADLQSLAEAHVTGAYDPRQRGYSRELSGRATARAMTADQSVVRNRNPIRQVANRVSRWRNTRQGTATLKAAYSQAAKDVKRMDPAVRESIGRSRITKADLQNLSQSAMQQTFRPEGRQTPYQAQARFQQQFQSTRAAQGQAQPNQQSPARAQRAQGQSGGRHRQQGRAEQLAASYQALRQGPGRHRAGATHQAGQNQSPAAQQGLNLRQRLQAVKQFHQTLSKQSPTQQAATVAQVNNSAKASARTNGDAAKAFAGVAGANGAVGGKPTSHRADPKPKSHAGHRQTDTKER